MSHGQERRTRVIITTAVLRARRQHSCPKRRNRVFAGIVSRVVTKEKPPLMLFKTIIRKRLSKTLWGEGNNCNNQNGFIEKKRERLLLKGSREVKTVFHVFDKSNK